MPHPAPLPCLEPLETRLAPAGLVTVTSSGDTLTITGDGEDNNLDIRDNGDGTWTIRDLGPMGTIYTLGGQSGLADEAQPMPDIVVRAPTHLKVNLQGGSDYLELEGLHIAGNVLITDAVAGGDDTVIFHSTVISGTTKVDLGDGNDRVTTEYVTFGKLLTLQGGSGSDTYTLGRGFYTGIKADFGTGSDTFALRGGEGDITVQGRVDLVSKSTSAEALTIQFGAATLMITGHVSVKTGAGGSLLDLGTRLEGTLRVLGGFTYTGGDGADAFRLATHLFIGGRLDIKTGDGPTLLTTGGLGTLTLGSLNFTGGQGEDRLDFTRGRIQILGDATFNLAHGDNEMRVIYGEVDLSIGGKFTYKGGSGSDWVTLNGSRLHIAGPVHISPGDGKNTFEMVNAEAWVGAITYTGGKGADSFQVGYYTATVGTTHVFGHITASLGAGKNFGSISDAHVHGHVRLTSATDDPSHVRGSEHLGIRDSIITGTTHLKATGTSGTTAALHNSIFQGRVLVETGRGSDEVVLDNSIPDFSMKGRKNQFHGAVRILLGAGLDVLNLHAPDPALYGNIFHSTFYADGGPGKPITGDHNILFGIPSSAHFFSTAPTLKNFQPVV